MPKININDSNVETVKVPISEEYSQDGIHQKGVTQVLSAISNGRNPFEAYISAVQSNDINASLDNWNKTTTEDRLRIIDSQLGYLDSEQVQSELEQLNSHLDVNTPEQGNYIETIKSLPQSVSMDNASINKEAVLVQMRELLSEYTPQFNEMDLGELSSNIGGLLIPKRSGVAYTKLLSDMGFISDTSDQAMTLIDPTSSIMKLRNMFWSLDDQGQIEFMNLLAEHLPNASDNKFIRSEIVHSILDGDFNTNVSHIFQNLDNLDLGLVSKAVFDLSKGLYRAGSVLNTLKKTDPDAAVDAINIAKEQPELAAKVGVTPADVGDALNPSIHGDVGTLLTGAPDDTAASIAKMLDVQDARFNAVTSAMERKGLLTQEEMNQVMKTAEIDQLKQPGVIEVDINQLDETGFKMKWTEAYFDSIGRLRKRNKEKIVDFTVNDLGELRAPVEDWVDKGLFTLDPNARTRNSLRSWFVSSVEDLSRKQEMTAKALDNMMKDAFGDLEKSWSFTGYNAKKAAMNVDYALQYGAKQGRTYTYDELVNGITGRTLSPKEAKAYIGVRNVVEKLYRLKNKQIVDNYLANGVKLYDGKDGVLPIRSYPTWESANVAWKQVQVDSHHVLVPDGKVGLKGVELTGDVIPFKNKGALTKEMLKDAYEKGYVLARNHSQLGLFSKGETKTQWAFVKAKNVLSPRGQQVLHRIEGYMPKQRTGSYWFIKKSKNIGLSGAKEHKVQVTEAYSDTEEAALEWVRLQDNPDEFQVVFDRELTDVQRMYDVASTHGGMYAGSRKSTELPYVGYGDIEFADSFEALQHYINHIGRQYPASLYRIGSEERLLSFARDMGVNARGMSMHNVLGHAVNKGIPESSDRYKMLKGIHDQLAFVNMIPTTDELNMANRWKIVGRFFENDLMKKIPGWNNVPKYFYQKAAKNVQPQDLIRGITFNHLLGMYNPAQFIVQYSGALVSFSIDPINAPLHIAKQWGWTVMDTMATDPIAQEKMLKWFISNGLKDYVDDYKLWSKSGFRESVVQGNADYTSVFTKNLPYDAGVLRKVLANHTLFYKMGELANTRMAFATAITRYKKVHNVDKINPDNVEALNEIGLWAEKYRLNMSRANQSALNKGWKAVPFQFQQIISKYFEKVLPQFMGGTDELSSVEKIRLGIIPTIATGVVGIPAGEFVATKIMELAGIDQKDLTEEETRAIKHGVIGWINSDMFNLNVNFSERMTLGGDVLKNMWESITTGKMTWQWFGATGNVADKYWRNGQYLSEAFDLLINENPDVTMNDLMAMPSIILEAASDIPSVTHNFKQYSAHIFSDNPSFIKDGQYMWDWETMNKRTAFFSALGFQPEESTDMYEINKKLKDSPVEFSVFGDTDADVILRIVNTRLLNGKDIKDTALYARIINSMIKKYGPAEQLKLMDTLKNKTLTRKFDQNNLLYKFLVEESTRQQDDLNFLNSLIARKLEERK